MTSSRRNTDPDIDDAQLSALVQLRLLPGLSDQRLLQLFRRYDPKSLVQTRSTELLGEGPVAALESRIVQQRLALALAMIDKLLVDVLSIRHAMYPERMRVLGDYAPPILFCRGRMELLDTRSVAVIGARNSTEYGDSVAELLAGELARRRVTVVSGLARGIDAVAHDSAQRAGGSTVAVLGCGIDVHYPPANARLQDRIAEEGLLISEFAPGAPALPRNFPQRNRLIAVLSDGVLVVEAGVKSGTLKTVEWALKHNVEVFAVPGPIGRSESQGTNELLRDGAQLVMSVRDIFEGLKWRFDDASEPGSDGGAQITALEGAARTVYVQVPATALHVDTIARRAGLSVPEALAQLMLLELEGLVAQHPGKRFARVLRRALKQKA